MPYVRCRAGLRSEVDKDGKSQQEVTAREEAVKDAAERSEHESWTPNSVIGWAASVLASEWQNCQQYSVARRNQCGVVACP